MMTKLLKLEPEEYKGKLGLNLTPFRLYRDELDDPTKSFITGHRITYQDRECHVLNDPIMVGRNGKLVQQTEVMLITNDVNDFIWKPKDISNIHYLSTMGIHIRNPTVSRHIIHERTYSERSEEDVLKDKFSFLDTKLDFAGLKELDSWYENLRTWTDE